MNAKGKHIAVLMGGWSPEREVSLSSGKDCADALVEAGYSVTEVDVDRNIAAELAEIKPDVAFNALHGSVSWTALTRPRSPPSNSFLASRWTGSGPAMAGLHRTTHGRPSSGARPIRTPISGITPATVGSGQSTAPTSTGSG